MESFSLILLSNEPRRDRGLFTDVQRKCAVVSKQQRKYVNHTSNNEALVHRHLKQNMSCKDAMIVDRHLINFLIICIQVLLQQITLIQVKETHTRHTACMFTAYQYNILPLCQSVNYIHLHPQAIRYLSRFQR